MSALDDAVRHWVYADEAEKELASIRKDLAYFRRTNCELMGIEYYESDDTPYLDDKMYEEVVALREQVRAAQELADCFEEDGEYPDGSTAYAEMKSTDKKVFVLKAALKGVK